MTRDTLGLFVTGTDTGVGKTLLTCALVRWLRASGIDGVAFKPVATGDLAGEGSDEDRAELKKRIASGEYKVDSEKVAEKMIGDHAAM